jgi:hypothetical protein
MQDRKTGRVGNPTVKKGQECKQGICFALSGGMVGNRSGGQVGREQDWRVDRISSRLNGRDQCKVRRTGRIGSKTGGQAGSVKELENRQNLYVKEL